MHCMTFYFTLLFFRVKSSILLPLNVGVINIFFPFLICFLLDYWVNSLFMTFLHYNNI